MLRCACIYAIVCTTRFEWDGAKNRQNRRKHGVDFAVAALVFDDPNDIFGGPRMADKQNLVHQTDGLPAFLTVHVAILNSACQGISKHVNGLLEAQMVPSLIGKVFRFIPLEKH